MQPRRSKQAAQKFFRELLKGLQYIPRAIITDKLRSYLAAMAEVMPSVQHQQQSRLNNRAKNQRAESLCRSQGTKAKRDVYVYDATFAAVWEAATQ